MPKKKLGRGLSSLLQIPHEEYRGVQVETVSRIPIASVVPNPSQPRSRFNEESISDLGRSIQSQGLIQPISVRLIGSHYEILAGERRLRACKQLGWEEIPALLKDVDDEAAVAIALIENIQREDLDPIERARAYLTLTKQFSLTHEQVAQRVGLKRSSVSNMLRLLELSEQIQEMLRNNSLSMGHARALLAIPDPAIRLSLATEVVEKGLSVRDVEQRNRSALISPPNQPKSAKKSSSTKSAHLSDLERQFESALGTKVRIQTQGDENRGRIAIHFYDPDDFARIQDLLLGRS